MGSVVRLRENWCPTEFVSISDWEALSTSVMINVTVDDPLADSDEEGVLLVLLRDVIVSETETVFESVSRSEIDGVRVTSRRGVTLRRLIVGVRMEMLSERLTAIVDERDMVMLLVSVMDGSIEIEMVDRLNERDIDEVASCDTDTVAVNVCVTVLEDVPDSVICRVSVAVARLEGVGLTTREGVRFRDAVRDALAANDDDGDTDVNRSCLLTVTVAEVVIVVETEVDLS